MVNLKANVFTWEAAETPHLHYQNENVNMLFFFPLGYLLEYEYKYLISIVRVKSKSSKTYFKYNKKSLSNALKYFLLLSGIIL